MRRVLFLVALSIILAAVFFADTCIGITGDELTHYVPMVGAIMSIGFANKYSKKIK